MNARRHGRGREPEHRILPIALWPDVDRGLWLRACTPGSPLDEDVGARASYAAITNTNDQKSYGRWLAYLRRHEPACLEQAPADRITAERVKRYVQVLQAIGNSSLTIMARLQQLGDVAKVMDPDRPWLHINRLAAKVRATHKPARHKHNLRPADELVDLGLELMIAAGTMPMKKGAVAYRDGFLIAVLALVPLRLRNLADLRLGETLIDQGSGWLIAFAEHQTKTHAVYEVRLPELLEPALATYLELYRPVLAAGDDRRTRALGTALWASRRGSPLSQHGIYCSVRARTGAAFGAAINPHLFRDAAATTLAVEDPAHVRVAAPLLGHRNFATTEKYYQQATALEAQRSFLDVIEGLKGGGTDG